MSETSGGAGDTTGPADRPPVAFVGLGAMGFPMAGHLARRGYAVTVYNRTPGRSAEWQQQHPGRVAHTPAAACQDAAFVMVCVGNDQDVRDVITGTDGVIHGIASGAVVVDHTTASAHLARELEAMLEARSIGFLDAPVSGGQIGAVNGQLTIMCGGKAETFDRACPVLDVYARAVRHMGGAGTGQLTKMVNQICIAGVLQGLAEGLAFAERADLDPGLVVDVIAKGAAQSWQMENRSTTMIEGRFDFGFAVDWMRKDLSIALEQARSLGASLPLTALVDQFYAEVQRRGGGRWDTSSLIVRQRG